MRIRSWNCNGAFRNKYGRLAEFDDAYGDDILVVQESEEPSRLPDVLLERYPNTIWIESTPRKGMLVLGSERYRLEIWPEYDETYKFVVPIHVTGESDFTLIAVWAQTSPGVGYADYVMSALRQYGHLIDEDSVVVGDFNATPKVAKPRASAAGMEDIVGFLSANGLFSYYHHVTGEALGEETMATYAHRRDLSQRFHIDYLFASERALRCSAGFGDINADDIELSDHRPIIVSPGITRRPGGELRERDVEPPEAYTRAIFREGSEDETDDAVGA